MVLTINLRTDAEKKLLAEAERRGIAAEQVVEELIETSLPAMVGSQGDESEHSIMRLARRFHASVPPEELALNPPDLSVNYKHYLYGTPKAEP